MIWLLPFCYKYRNEREIYLLFNLIYFNVILPVLWTLKVYNEFFLVMLRLLMWPTHVHFPNTVSWYFRLAPSSCLLKDIRKLTTGSGSLKLILYLRTQGKNFSHSLKDWLSWIMSSEIQVFVTIFWYLSIFVRQKAMLPESWCLRLLMHFIF